MDQPSNNFEDIYRMHQHHQLPIGAAPNWMKGTDQKFREDFMREELLEFQIACEDRNLPEAADALIDLVVVTMGTAVMMGFPWQALWQDVLRANMTKVRIESDRAHGGYDLGKPEDWVAPRSDAIINEFILKTPAPVYSDRPRVVTLCGSTRFKEAYIYWNRHLTLKGFIVLTIGFFGHADDEPISATTKAALDQLHLHKIRVSDEVFIINVGGYIGISSRNEIEYARSLGKPIRYLEEV